MTTLSLLRSIYLFPISFVLWYFAITQEIHLTQIHIKPWYFDLLIFLLLIPFVFFVGIVWIQSRL